MAWNLQSGISMLPMMDETAPFDYERWRQFVTWYERRAGKRHLMNQILERKREMTEAVKVTRENARGLSVKDVIDVLVRKGARFQEIRRVVKARFGAKLEYLGHDRKGGRAAARRVRQMAVGTLPGRVALRLCVGCGAQIPNPITLDICPVCLEKKWSD